LKHIFYALSSFVGQGKYLLGHENNPDGKTFIERLVPPHFDEGFAIY